MAEITTTNSLNNFILIWAFDTGGGGGIALTTTLICWTRGTVIS